MKTLLAVFAATIFLFTSPALACGVQVYMHADVNPEPVKWMYYAMQKNRICGDLLSFQTASSGASDKRHKRGARDTIVFIPAGLEALYFTDVIYWFHGLTGFKEKTFVRRLGPQYGWLVNQQLFPAILVVAEMPWSRFTTTQWKRQGQVFRHKDEFLLYTDEVESHILRHLAWQPIRLDRVVIGHSAGGSAIASAARYGGLCKVNPAGIVFSDSTYGSWFARSWRGCLRDYATKRAVRIMVLGQSFGTPWKNYRAWSRKNMSAAKKIEAYRLPLPWTHGRIGSNAIPFFYGRFKNGKYENIYEK